MIFDLACGRLSYASRVRVTPTSILVVPGGGADEVINADISGSEVQFQIDLCDYEGVVAGDEMYGVFMCEFAVSGRPVQFDGTWQATRTEG